MGAALITKQQVSLPLHMASYTPHPGAAEVGESLALSWPGELRDEAGHWWPFRISNDFHEGVITSAVFKM